MRAQKVFFAKVWALIINMLRHQKGLKIDFLRPHLYMAIWAGLRGVPLIFLSGDDAACREAESDVPGIVTATVKWGQGANSEITLSAPASHQLIRERIQFAVEAHRRTPVAPIPIAAPYSLTIRWISTQLADEAESVSGCERIDGKTTKYRSAELLDVLRRLHRPAESGVVSN